MAASPQYKVYNPKKEYVAACKFASDAAALASLYGDGATVRLEHNKVLWTEGQEEQSAAESYDYAADIILERHEAIMQKAFAKVYGTKEYPEGPICGDRSGSW